MFLKSSQVNVEKTEIVFKVNSFYWFVIKLSSSCCMVHLIAIDFLFQVILDFKSQVTSASSFQDKFDRDTLKWKQE